MKNTPKIRRLADLLEGIISFDANDKGNVFGDMRIVVEEVMAKDHPLYSFALEAYRRQALLGPDGLRRVASIILSVLNEQYPNLTHRGGIRVIFPELVWQ